MISLENNNFVIAIKMRKIIYELSDMLEVVPKKYYFQKNKLLTYAYDLLENIYIINNAYSSEYASMIIKDIAMIDLTIGFFLDKKCVSVKQVEKILYRLTEISKMTNVWISNIKRKNNES